MPFNHGVVITGSRSRDHFVSIEEIPYPKLEEGWVIVRGHAYANNPTDWKHIYLENIASVMAANAFKKLGFGFRSLETVFGGVGAFCFYHLGKSLTFFQKGNTVGNDVSGVVVEVGENVTKLKKGDIVAASIHGAVSKNGSFADYVLVPANGTVKFDPSQISAEPLAQGEHPSSTISSFEAAASVPLGLKTVAGSFCWNLKISDDKAKNKDDFILIWGGATATGFIAIQIAKSILGLKVITTASKKHHDLLKELGADEVFDYHDADVVDQLKAAGGNNIKYALDTVSTLASLQATYDATEGSDIPVIDNLLFLNEKSIHTKPERKVSFTTTNVYISDGKTHLGMTATPEMTQAFNAFWDSHMPSFVKTMKTAPLQVLPPSLASAKTGMQLLMENKISGRKVVFRNPNV